MLQKLWEYRNKLAYKAVCTVFSYYCSEIDDGANANDDSAELAKFAKFLLTEHNFVFKGMESSRNVSPNLSTSSTSYMDACSYSLSVAKEKRHVSTYSHHQNTIGAFLWPYGGTSIEWSKDR